MPEAYETLLLDAMLGDPTLFARHDFVEASWALITPVHDAWRAAGRPSLPTLRGGGVGSARGRRDDGGRRTPLEDAVSAKAADDLLQHGREVPFAEIEATLARLARDGRRRHAAGSRPDRDGRRHRPAERLTAAAEALEHLRRSRRRPRHPDFGRDAHRRRWRGSASRRSRSPSLAPRYLNNAVAALRLSSLPALVWWRGGSLDALDDLADLADRLVLDTDRMRTQRGRGRRR